MLRVGGDSLDFALTHIIAKGDTDVFPPAFEFAAVFDSWDSIRGWLADQDLDVWSVRPLRSCLAPKRALGFRSATQLDPLDALLITAVVYEVAENLEAARVPISDALVHSYRYEPTPAGQFYSVDWNFQSFRKQSLEMAAHHDGLVVMSDIADFFPRLYLHRLENALELYAQSRDHARVITKMLSGWNQSVSYGIPVGPAVFRLLAEVTIDDVDRALLSEGFRFCRFSDDYRIFVPDERRAHEACAFLAKTLASLHGLTIQESKTEIVAAEDFVRRFERTEEDAERESLSDRFELLHEQLLEREEQELQALAVQHGIDRGWFGEVGRYEQIDYEDLDEDQKAIVDGLNLWEVLRDEVEGDHALDVPLTRFTLNRIAQLKLADDERCELLLQDLRRLYSLFPEVIRALSVQASSTPERRIELGARLLALFEHPVVGHLEYHRDWILSVFAVDASWNHAHKLVQLYGDYADHFTRPGIVRALGAALVRHWFRGRKQDVLSLPPWERRAFLAGAACLPNDESRHWYQSVIRQLDVLEQAVVRWAQSKQRAEPA